MMRRWVLHPFLLAIYPILALFSRNVYETRPIELAWPILLVVLGTSAVWAVWWLFVRDVQKAGLLASLCVVLFFTVARITEIANHQLSELSAYWVQTSVRIWPPYAIAPEIVLFLVLCALVVRWVKKPGTLTAALNLFAIVLIAMPVSWIALAKASTESRATRRVEPFAIAPSAESRPDIYYIILDAYARTDVMQALFDFDNNPFLESLERKGFHVTRRSTANYCQTPLCLSSSLNSTYLDDLVQGLGRDQTELRGFIGRNRIVETLRPLGYKFVTFSTGFEPTEHPEADAYYAPFHQLSEFHRLLVDVTPLGALFLNPSRADLFTMARERVLYLLDNLADVAADRTPTFTFAHILCPHPPFVFGEDGEDVSHRDDRFFLTDGQKFLGTAADPEIYRRGYRAQAIFLTRRIEQVIDRILAESPEPPIIILQSDHGSGWKLDMHSLDRTDLKERMSILNAYYFPGQRYHELRDTISPVNSFRVVLNTFFGGRLPYLPDQSFYSTWDDPYAFIDVSSRVHGRLYDEEPQATPEASELEPEPDSTSGE
ncbi:hypothetical protein [Paludisphaera borealis]|uniref:Sulfatase N-terminal domain-containing protein n=1 Tax=Paludisphaera borealis TaxID=1387353 RepID=A0A1U7CLE0_9BACT|nr:hypothetical protein [Paludisphaera borealis]APW59741.1 hypothetical protein BSF38_01172 [Paludisphaera borealis]